ncbi:hypothetical protein OAP56_04900, partial [Rickettsiaceae bacterium]|nr:hypothetical protein [Rickettsiaceae bacterium]
FIFIIILLFLVGFAVTIQKNPHLFKNTSGQNAQAVEKVKEESSLQQSTEQNIESEDDDGEVGEDNTENDNNISEVEDKEVPAPEVSIKSTSQNHTRSNFTEYRLYLANAHKLISKFKSGKNYATELDVLKKQTFPAHIDEIISMLEQYNKVLTDSSSIKADIKPLNSSVLAKFVKMTRTSEDVYKEHKLKDEIMKRLTIFMDYMFSSDLQENFIN